MAGLMKTTVHIADALLADIQKIAAKRQTTLKALVDEGLRHVIASEGERKKAFKLKDCSVGVKGAAWPLEGKSWEEVRAMIYEGHGE
jgi:Arc/MetJ family transcription regulator